jgi:hypothetical protein
MIPGIDYSFGRPAPADIYKAGDRFVVRYLSGVLADGTYRAKDLTRPEYDALRKAHLDVALVFEVGNAGAKGGYAQGVKDAKAALAEIAHLALPGTNRPVYFAIDFDAYYYPATRAQALSYIRGAASVLGFARTGVYGGYSMVKHCLDARACAFAWQTIAWSPRGKWDSRAHLRQTGSKRIGHNVVDTNVATVPDFGQWPPPAAPVNLPVPPAGIPKPKPTPKPTPKPKPKPPKVLRLGSRDPAVNVLSKALGFKRGFLGIYTPAIRSAVLRYQRRHLIPPTGTVNARLYRRITGTTLH